MISDCAGSRWCVMDVKQLWALRSIDLKDNNQLDKLTIPQLETLIQVTLSSIASPLNEISPINISSRGKDTKCLYCGYWSHSYHSHLPSYRIPLTLHSFHSFSNLFGCLSSHFHSESTRSRQNDLSHHSSEYSWSRRYSYSPSVSIPSFLSLIE